MQCTQSMQSPAAIAKTGWNPADTSSSRQWPEVYDLCHTFLHIARVRKHTDMRELHAKHTDMRELHAKRVQLKRVQFSHVRVFSDSRNVQKRATKSDTSGHCLDTSLLISTLFPCSARAQNVSMFSQSSKVSGDQICKFPRALLLKVSPTSAVLHVCICTY